MGLVGRPARRRVAGLADQRPLPRLLPLQAEAREGGHFGGWRHDLLHQPGLPLGRALDWLDARLPDAPLVSAGLASSTFDWLPTEIVS